MRRRVRPTSWGGVPVHSSHHRLDEDYVYGPAYGLRESALLRQRRTGAEFYDLLRWHVLDLAKRWPTLPLSDDETLVLAARKARLLCELDYLRSLAVLENGPGPSNQTP